MLMQKKISQYLLTPGPLTTSSLTKEAMQRDVGSWDGDFRKITNEIEIAFRILLTAFSFTGFPSKAPFKSTTCIQEQPASSKTFA